MGDDAPILSPLARERSAVEAIGGHAELVKIRAVFDDGGELTEVALRDR